MVGRFLKRWRCLGIITRALVRVFVWIFAILTVTVVMGVAGVDVDTAITIVIGGFGIARLVVPWLLGRASPAAPPPVPPSPSA